MVTTKTQKYSVLTVVLCLLLCLVSLGAIQFVSAEDVPTWSGATLNAKYVSHNTLTLPTKKVSVGGKEAAATAVVTYPDGTAKNVLSLLLEQTGRYCVSYTASVDGKLYATAENFEVVSANVLTGANSTAAWGASEPYADEGLLVALAQGETIEFANTIALDDPQAQDATTPLIEMYVAPENIGRTDFRRLYITFTDSLDPTETVTVLLGEYSDGRPETMLSASVKGEQYVSWEWYSDNIFRGEDSWHAHANSSFGVNYGSNHYAQKTRPIRLWYESASKQIFYHTLDGDDIASNKKMLIDLDDTRFYNTLFEGFSSGRVKISMRADKYNRNTPARFIVKRMGNIDLTRSVALFGNAPAITVDCDFDINDPPAAKAGGTYPVPTATAVDGEGVAVPVQTSVYYSAVAGGGRVDVATADGRFSTAKAGVYTIEYVATDRGGLSGKKRITVSTADTSAPTVSATVPSEIKAGVKVNFIQSADISGDGAVVSVAVNGTAVKVPSAYMFERAGAHTVTYTVTDIRGQTGTAEYAVTVTSNTTPTALEGPELPPIVIAGCRYFLPDLTAYTFDADGKHEVKTTCMLTDNRGTNVVKSGETVVPVVAENGDTVKVAYKADETTVYEQELPCVKAYNVVNGRKRIQIQNYFVGEGLDYTLNTDSMTCAATDGNSGMQDFVFARALPAEGFSVMLGTIPSKSDYESVTVTLFDPTTDVSVSYRIECETTEYGDGYTRKTGYIATANARIPMPALFIRDGGTVTGMYRDGNWVFNSDYSLRITTDDAGRPFGGFDGDVYCRVTFGNAAAGAAFNVYNIYGQTISANPLDGIAPTVRVEGDYGGDKTIGSQIVVGKATAFDVLDAMTTLGVSVTAPDGSFVTSDDGVLLENAACDREYTFTAEQYGTYAVYYRAFDTLGGNMGQFSYNYVVCDDTAPEIKFKSDAPTTGKVGTAFVLPDFDVTDDTTAPENITVYKSVIAPNLDSTYLKGNVNAYVPRYAGKYTVVITATDERGNACVQSFTVNVQA